jgi:hypothetical protein
MWDRLEAFWPNIWSLVLGVGYESVGQNGLRSEFGLQMVTMIPTDDRGDTEVAIDYSVELWYAPQRFALGGGFFGRMFATEEDANFDERTLHQIGLAATYTAGKFKPGIHLRLPLDEVFDSELDYVYGVNIAYSVR